MAIIFENGNQNISNAVLSDDGTGAGIRIPALLISRNDGLALKRQLVESDEQ